MSRIVTDNLENLAGTASATVEDIVNGQVLRDDLAAPSGAALIGYDSGTAQTVLDNAKALSNYTALRAYTGRATGVRITQAGLAGFFQRDASDTTSGASLYGHS